MKKKQLVVITLGAILVFSVVFGAVSFYRPRATTTREQLNSQVNGLVDSCVKTLPAGIPECDEQLRDIVSRLCQQDPTLDACSDGRVEEYYKSRGRVS